MVSGSFVYGALHRMPVNHFRYMHVPDCICIEILMNTVVRVLTVLILSECERPPESDALGAVVTHKVVSHRCGSW